MIKTVGEVRNDTRDSDDEDVGDRDFDEDSVTEVEDNDEDGATALSPQSEGNEATGDVPRPNSLQVSE